jgi:hypothetical protein
MKSSIIIATMGLAMSLLGCASQYKQDAKQEQQAKTMPVNCATAQGDIAMLQKEKVSAGQQAAAGVSTTGAQEAAQNRRPVRCCRCGYGRCCNSQIRSAI